MAKYKKRPTKVDEFIEGASYDSGSERGRPPKPEDEKYKPFTTRLTPEMWEKLRAYAWYKRTSQREVVESALDELFDGRQDEVREAVQKYKAENQD